MTTLKEQIKQKRLRQYEVAAFIGINEFTLSRWLRDEDNLSETKRKIIEKAMLEAEKSMN